jgi:hypothetical protein
MPVEAWQRRFPICSFEVSSLQRARSAETSWHYADLPIGNRVLLLFTGVQHYQGKVQHEIGARLPAP